MVREWLLFVTDCVSVDQVVVLCFPQHSNYSSASFVLGAGPVQSLQHCAGCVVTAIKDEKAILCVDSILSIVLLGVRSHPQVWVLRTPGMLLNHLCRYGLNVAVVVVIVVVVVVLLLLLMMIAFIWRSSLLMSRLTALLSHMILHE